jgi:uncharacterized phage-associated protein
MRLQKLLYYAQGWHLASFTTPLFAERIEAWKYGPVVKEVYSRFAEFGYQAIPPSEGADSDTLTEAQKSFIQAIWKQYGMLSATALRDMTHREAPWMDARKGLPAEARSDAEISQEAMRPFFRMKLLEKLRRQDSRIDPAAWEASAAAIDGGRAQTVKDILLDLHRRHSRAHQE